MTNFSGKTIIIATPNHYGLLQRFRENLEVIGFHTIIIPDDLGVRIGFRNNLIHIYKKIIKGDNSFKKEKKIELRVDKQIEIIESQNVDVFDYALFIRPDLYSNDLISYIKRKAQLICAYQWDGLDRFPNVYNKISLFDRFFVFDEMDLSKNINLLPTTNFYFDDIPTNRNKDDIYFVGTFLKDRINLLMKLVKIFEDLNLKLSINLSLKNNYLLKKQLPKSIKIIRKPLSFRDNLLNVAQSRVILDFANNIHNGLSMRTFESIGFRKKLITNNPLVKKYDFYNPNNIFVIENEQLDGIESFIDLPYEELSEEIYKKYSFTNWIKQILNID